MCACLRAYLVARPTHPTPPTPQSDATSNPVRPNLRYDIRWDFLILFSPSISYANDTPSPFMFFWCCFVEKEVGLKKNMGLLRLGFDSG